MTPEKLKSIIEAALLALLALSVDYQDDVPAGMVERANSDLEIAIKARFPVVKRMFIEVQSAQHHAEELERAAAARAAEE